MTSFVTSEAFILFAVFGSILLAGMGIILSLNQDAGAKRIRTFARSEHSPEELDHTKTVLITDTELPRALRMLEPLQRKLAQSDPKQVTAARAKLIEAGYYRRNAVETYFALRILLGVSFAIASIIYFLIFPAVGSANMKLFSIVGAAALGYYGPVMFVTLKVRSRQEKFRLGMPDALDMMLVGVEAGLSLGASIKHIVKEFADVHPIISEQFQIVTLEFQAGRSRADALVGLSKRVNLPVTRTLASMINQSEALGTSMAQTLQVMAEDLRNQRMLEAEKRAAELPVKMAVPLVLCIFPALMAVALVPAMLTTMEFFVEISRD